MSTERIQKILAQAGIASRRKAEELIQMGLVTVNGKVAKIGEKANLETDAIKVDGKLILRTENHVYIAFYKPRGVISMMGDPEGRPTIADYLTKVKARVFPIGRLDYNSEGLLLLTNDGELVEKIQKNDEYPRVYHVKIKGHVTTEMLERLRRGGKVGTRFVKPHSVRIADELNKKTRIEIAFVNAANVDVKTYFESKGFLIERMTRTAFGNITLKGLVPGQYRIIPKTKLQALLEQPELGIKALELKNAKETLILPKDQRMGSVDTDGKIRIKPVATPVPVREAGKRPAFKKPGGRAPFKRGPGGRSTGARSAGTRSAGSKEGRTSFGKPGAKRFGGPAKTSRRPITTVKRRES